MLVRDALKAVGWDGKAPAWPPDVFAYVAVLLSRSGAYTKVVDRWPPSRRSADPSKWAADVRDVARQWRQSARAAKPPVAVTRRWRLVTESLAISMSALPRHKRLVEALLELCAIADETCQGLGVPGADGATSADDFGVTAELLLLNSGTLCRKVSPSAVRVLPKLHTPQVGVTLRSLTHHVALVECTEVSCDWFAIPGGPRDRAGMNLLLVPWPLNVAPDQFRAIPGQLENMPDGFGFFGFEPRVGDNAVRKLRRLLDAAQALVGDVHAVVLPELSVTEDQHRQLTREVVHKRGAMLIAGIAGKASAGRTAKNFFTIEMSTVTGSPVTIGPQAKHHRWQLDSTQILNYGLGAHLNHKTRWWEHISIGDRKVAFLSMNPWLTLTVLLCEDLARQDPVSQIVRAVGPNLVITLLMDGPQRRDRWAARYATVLADDPGCSVLTLTSLGMSRLCRPPGFPSPQSTIALWKDAKTGGPREIEMPTDADGVVLTLCAEFDQEWTADGRGDDRTTGFPVVAGVHPVYLQPR